MGLTLRRADITDAEQLYAWRKQDEREPWWVGDDPSLADHLDWLRPRLHSPVVHLYVALENSHPVGQVRVDSNGELSFSIALEHRRQGLGSEMLRQTAERCGSLYGGRLKANCDKSNRASIRCLEAAGFRERTDVVMLRWPA